MPNKVMNFFIVTVHYALRRLSGCEYLNGESLFLAQYSFTGLVQRIFNRDKIRDKQFYSRQCGPTGHFDISLWTVFLCRHTHELQSFKHGLILAHSACCKQVVF